MSARSCPEIQFMGCDPDGTEAVPPARHTAVLVETDGGPGFVPAVHAGVLQAAHTGCDTGATTLSRPRAPQRGTSLPGRFIRGNVLVLSLVSARRRQDCLEVPVSMA